MFEGVGLCVPECESTNGIAEEQAVGGVEFRHRGAHDATQGRPVHHFLCVKVEHEYAAVGTAPRDTSGGFAQAYDCALDVEFVLVFYAFFRPEDGCRAGHQYGKTVHVKGVDVAFVARQQHLSERYFVFHVPQGGPRAVSMFDDPKVHGHVRYGGHEMLLARRREHQGAAFQAPYAQCFVGQRE